jgi:hypothetical protein
MAKSKNKAVVKVDVKLDEPNIACHQSKGVGLSNPILCYEKNMTNLRAAARSTSKLPSLSQTQIAKRWQLDADTVRMIIRSHHLMYVPGPWKRAR